MPWKGDVIYQGDMAVTGALTVGGTLTVTGAISGDGAIDCDDSLTIDSNKITFEAAEPSSGVYADGDIIFNTNGQAAGFVGWVCITAGTAGAGAAFKTFGVISA